MNVPQFFKNELKLLSSIKGFKAKAKVLFFYPLIALISKILDINADNAFQEFLFGVNITEVCVKNEFSSKREELSFEIPDQNSLKSLLFEEKWMIEYLRLKEDTVFIDAGAHVSKYTIQAAKIAELIISIEPDPINFDCLKANCLKNDVEPRVKLVNAALSDRSERLRLFKSENSLDHSIKKDKGSREEGHVACPRIEDCSIRDVGGEVQINFLGTPAICKGL